MWRCQSHGLNTATFIREKSAMLRVTTVNPCIIAVAAIMASCIGRGSGTCKVAQCSLCVYRQNPACKRRSYIVIHPCSQPRGLSSIVPMLNSEDAHCDLKDRDDRQIKFGLMYTFRPCNDLWVSFARRTPQLGNDVGVEQEHHGRSTGRNASSDRRAGSNSISSPMGGIISRKVGPSRRR